MSETIIKDKTIYLQKSVDREKDVWYYNQCQKQRDKNNIKYIENLTYKRPSQQY